MYFFFFSSRRRHTRYWRDWSSDVCSSDLLLLGAARARMPKLVAFGERYPGVFALTESAQLLDRQLLSDLPRQAWDSAAFALGERLTDAAIEDAVRRLPPEHHALVGARMAAALRARRDELP